MTRRKRSLIAAVALLGAALLSGFADGPDGSPVDCRAARCVALVFEGGPGPHTGALLDALEEAHAPATFFVTGKGPVFRHPDLVHRMAWDGHQVGNGTWTGPRLTDVPAREVRRQLTQTQRALIQVTGRRPTLVRPPQGRTDRHVARICAELGLRQVLGPSYAAGHRPAAEVAQRALEGARSGGTVVLNGRDPVAAAAAPALVEALRARGYRLVTADRLAAPRP
ncbi:polysaccharide deacetylase family protein [Streptomyces sp. NPDC051561]|uniref:polysaccharide deacetylase family protein n=1 Tax=Streptomyces sp. NPDC051561 TaxID=3365658 RepID=UPI0037B55A42